MPFDLRPVLAHPSKAPGAHPRCELCPAGPLCPVNGVSSDDRACWGAALQGLVSLPATGKTLFEAGAPALAIYVVRAGCMKSFTVDPEGNERVRAFYFPGDVVGLDALGVDTYPASVAAVTASQACRLPVAEVRELAVRAPGLMLKLLDRMSRDLAAALTLSGDYTAQQRVASFLVEMGRRLGGGGSVTLPMTRREIASHLRLATETVCRVLTRFEEQGRIACENRTVRLIDGAMLRALAEPVNLPPAMRNAA